VFVVTVVVLSAAIGKDSTSNFLIVGPHRRASQAGLIMPRFGMTVPMSIAVAR
jgi:hypothetical protein